MNRESFVGRVRQALGRAAGDPVSPPPDVASADLVAPSVAGLAGPGLVAHFVARARLVGAHVHLAADPAAAVAVATALVHGAGGTAVGDASALATAIVAAVGALETDPASAAVGVTQAWRGVAETGTVVVRSDGGRVAGLLPPVHVVLLPAHDLRPGLSELYADVATGEGLPAALVQITGPSRTADIEMTLVTGVHGPGEVHVIVIGAGA